MNSKLKTTNKKHLNRTWMKHFIVLCVAALFGIATFQLLNENEIDRLELSQNEALFEATSLFSAELGKLSDLAVLLSIGDVLKVDKTSNTDDLTSGKHKMLSNQQIERIQQYFINFAKVSENISQIRWIDAIGQERIRVDFREGQQLIPELLQNKSQRYYFSAGMQMPDGQVFLSPLDLNVENGEIQKPYEPTARAAIRTSHSEFLVNGLLVINYQINSLFSRLKEISDSKSVVHVINGQGYWLLHQDPMLEWGFMTGSESNKISQTDSFLWQKFNQTSAGKFKHNGNVVSFAKINALNNGMQENGVDLIFYSYGSNSITMHLFDLVYALLVFTVVLIFGLFYNLREFYFQQKLVKLSDKLIAEKQTLKTVNHSLKEYITRQKLLQDELVETRKLASLGLMVSGVAHELNTPIGGANIALSSAQKAHIKLNQGLVSGITRGDYKSAVDIIDKSLSVAENNMKKAVSRIKKFEQLAIDKVSEDIVEFSLNDLIEDTVNLLTPLIKNKDIEIRAKIEHQIQLRCSTSALTQVLENLIINCINHAFKNGEKGIISVFAKHIEQDKVSIKVADNGVGISEDIKPRLLEPFMTNARGQGNIGLGLYMAEQWVSNVLKGQLVYKSDTKSKRQFTTIFTITFPRETKVD